MTASETVKSLRSAEDWETTPMRARQAREALPGSSPRTGDGAAAAAAQALKDLDDGGLAGAVGSQEGQNGAGRDGEIQVLKDALVPVGLGQATDLDGGELRHTISV